MRASELPVSARLPGRLPSGWPALDARLGGGWPLGPLIEVCGQGRTSLALAAVASAQQHGLPVAWIDGTGGFCPATAEVDLARLTLVQAAGARVPGPRADGPRVARRRSPAAAALFAADVLLRSRSQGLLVLDLPARGGPAATWFRLGRLAAQAECGLLLLHAGRTALCGSAAALLVELRWAHTPVPAWGEFPPPALELRLRRCRHAAPVSETPGRPGPIRSAGAPGPLTPPGALAAPAANDAWHLLPRRGR